MKTLIIRVVTLLLVITFAGPIALEAQTTNSPPPPPPDKDLLAVACAVLAIGAVVIWGLWKICKKIPPLNPPNSGTNAPPVNPPPTNSIHTNPPAPPRKTALTTSDTFMFQLDLENVQRYSIAQYQFPDTVSGGYYTAKSKWSVLVSTNLTGDWYTTLTVSMFDNDYSGGQLWAVYRDGTNLYNAYFMPGADFNLPIDFALPGQPKEFFRLIDWAWTNPQEPY